MISGGGPNGRIGRWTVHEELGSGGMGVVYDATDGSGERAALKVIAPVFASDPAFRTRFRREIEVTRRVSGPRTAAVLDADSDADPPWLATEFVNGPTLAESVERTGALREPALTAFAVALLQALADIHGAGVVHRDLKPTNVILTVDTPKVIDFGIASAAEATSITATGAFMGSAGWMSPEQVSGTQVGAPSDVFSWAAVVAFAATGIPPFGAGRPEALAYRVVHGTPDLDAVPPALRARLEPAFARESEQRPTVGRLLKELAGPDPYLTVATGWSSVPPTAVSPTERQHSTRVGAAGVLGAQRSRKTRGWAWAVAVVAVVAVAVGLTMLGTNTGRTGMDDVAAEAAAAQVPATATSTVATTTTTTSAPTTSTTTTTTTAPPPSPDDPMNYFSTDGSAPVMTPDCLGLVAICWGDTVERVRALLGPEADRYGYVGEDGQPVVTRRWQIGTASITASFDFVESLTSIDVGPLGEVRNLRLTTPGGVSTPGAMDVNFEATTMGEVRRELGEPEVSTVAGEGMTIYFYGYRVGGEGFLNLLFSHTAFWDDDPGLGPALDARLVDSVEISDTTFADE